MNVQTPLALAVAVPSSLEPSKTVIVALAAAVPSRVNWFAVVVKADDGPLSGEADKMTGAAGIVTTGSGECGLVPPPLVAVAMISCSPADSDPALKLQTPLALAIVSPSRAVPS